MKLTRRQCEIMELVMRGLDNNAIAEKLFISITTLRTHLNNIYLIYGLCKIKKINPRICAANMYRKEKEKAEK